MRFLFFICAFFFTVPESFADTVDSYYKNNNGQYIKVNLASPVTATGLPGVVNFKNSARQWEGVQAISLVCGLDASQNAIPCDYLQPTRINQPLGIAGLDAGGHELAPLGSVGASVLYSSDGAPVMSVNPSQNDPTKPYQDNYAGGSLIKPHALLVTGARVGLPNTDDDHNANGQLYLVGQTDGPDGLGCLICVINSGNALPNTMPGISGGGSSNWANGASGIAEYGDADSPMEYLFEQNLQPVLTLDVASYTAGQIVLKSAMSAAQMARVHYGMYVQTNSVDPTLATPTFSATTSQGGLTFYASIVDHVVDNTHIAVRGWAVPGSGKTGGVPDTSSLDTAWTNFGKAVVGIGSPTNTSHINWVFDYEAGQSWVRNYENEIDLINNSGQDGRVRIRGLTMTYQGNAAPSADSWALNLNTAPMPVDIHMEVGAKSVGIESNAFWFHGNAGVSNQGDTWEMMESAAFAGSAQNMRLVSWLAQDCATAGYGCVSLHQGLIVNGTTGAVSTPQAQIIYDPLLPGHSANSTGVLGLSSFGGIDFSLDGGHPTVPQGNFLVLQPSNWTESSSVAPILQAASASQLNVRDTSGNGITLNTYGLTVGGEADVGTLVSSGNVNVKNGAYFQESLTTPASSTSACIAGEFTDDQNYHYVCVQTNTWKRVALSSF